MRYIIRFYEKTIKDPCVSCGFAVRSDLDSAIEVATDFYNSCPSHNFCSISMFIGSLEDSFYG